MGTQWTTNADLTETEWNGVDWNHVAGHTDLWQLL
jgi:hypothetical protein